ncbi:hypothetical protein ABT052_21175 [Streptomyces sp. NPDC002766]
MTPPKALPKVLRLLLWTLWLGCLVFTVWCVVVLYLAMTDV